MKLIQAVLGAVLIGLVNQKRAFVHHPEQLDCASKGCMNLKYEFHLAKSD